MNTLVDEWGIRKSLFFHKERERERLLIFSEIKKAT